MRFFFFLLHPWVCCIVCVVCEYACVYVHAHLCESQRKMLDVLVLFSLSSLETESLHEPKTRPAVSNPW